jgi:hypothetical protein
MSDYRTNDAGKTIGARVRRMEGRTVGEEGVIVAIHDGGSNSFIGSRLVSDVAGSGGDILVTVRKDDGSEIQPYMRQIMVVQ